MSNKIETLKEKIDEKIQIEELTKGLNTTVITTNVKTWWNRIISAVIGAIIAAAASIGITQTHITEQKNRVANIKELSVEALTALKAGDIETAKAALELASAEGKDLTAESKTIINNIKQYSAE